MKATTATALTLAGLVVGYYGLFGRAHLATIRRCNERIEAAYAARAVAEQTASTMPGLAASATELARWRTLLAPQMTLGDSAAAPLIEMQAALELDGLTVERAEALPPDRTLQRPNCRLRTAVTGTLSQVFLAVRNLENARPSTRVSEFNLQAIADSALVRCDLTIVRTWSLDR